MDESPKHPYRGFQLFDGLDELAPQEACTETSPPVEGTSNPYTACTRVAIDGTRDRAFLQETFARAKGAQLVEVDPRNPWSMRVMFEDRVVLHVYITEKRDRTGTVLARHANLLRFRGDGWTALDRIREVARFLKDVAGATV